MNNFKLKSNPEQILDYLNNTKIRNWNLEDIKTEIILRFDLFDLFELVSFSYKNDNLKTIINSLDQSNLYPIFQTSFRKIKASQVSLSTPDFMAFLIGHKFEVIEEHNININPYLQLIDSTILETRLVLNEMKFETFSTSDILGLFLVYDKRTALAIFSNYMSKLFKERTLDNIYIFLTTKVDVFFSLLKLEFIPQIDSKNVTYLNIYNNDDKRFITHDELKMISQEDWYFEKRIPLENIDQNQLLKDRNYKNKDLTYYILRKYFSELLGEKYQYLETNIFEIFISNFSEKYPRFDTLYLKNARSILSEVISTRENKYKFLAIFYYLSDSKNLLDVSNNLSFLFSDYFGKKLISFNSTREAFVKRSRSKKLIEEIKCIKIEQEPQKNVDYQ